MQIQPTDGISAASRIAVKETAQSPAGGSPHVTAGESFADVLKNVALDADRDLKIADESLHAFANGTASSAQEVILTTVKADLNFRLFLEMRNRVTESYQELSRMQF